MPTYTRPDAEEDGAQSQGEKEAKVLLLEEGASEENMDFKSP